MKYTTCCCWWCCHWYLIPPGVLFSLHSHLCFFSPSQWSGLYLRRSLDIQATRKTQIVVFLSNELWLLSDFICCVEETRWQKTSSSSLNLSLSIYLYLSFSLSLSVLLLSRFLFLLHILHFSNLSSTLNTHTYTPHMYIFPFFASPLSPFPFLRNTHILLLFVCLYWCNLCWWDRDTWFAARLSVKGHQIINHTRTQSLTHLDRHIHIKFRVHTHKHTHIHRAFEKIRESLKLEISFGAWLLLSCRSLWLNLLVTAT